MKKTKESKINVLKSLNNTSVLSTKQQVKIKGGSESEDSVNYSYGHPLNGADFWPLANFAFQAIKSNQNIEYNFLNQNNVLI